MVATTAEYYDGSSARGIPVRVALVNEDLEIRDAANILLATWALTLIRDENIPEDPTSLYLSLSAQNNARLRLSDPVLVETLRNRCPKLRARRKIASSDWVKPFAATIAVIVLIAGFVWYGIPWVADPLSRLIPQSTLSGIGQGVEKQIIDRFSKGKGENSAVCSEAGGEKLLQRVVGEIVLTASEIEERSPETVSIIVVRSKVANALALPGGRMVVFSGLLDMIDNPNALVGILAHEYAHVMGRHPTRLMLSNVGMATITSFLLGDVTGGTIAAAFGQMALGAAYSRDVEEEADRKALQVMSKLSYDIKPMIPVLKELSKKQPTNPMFDIVNTHPNVDDRVKILQGQPEMAFRPSMTEAEWAEIKTMCRSSI
ncbi:M48 family metallopeptidase [Sneathiella limimaris]|uniref:M48 family metallopeptidase n=1 Tax=Sneathiella limimaris TaxID=1964213 RepID=UPI00146B3EF8|nr:M48 family metallopeptidase [Sneathiella limimaris]